MQLPYCTWGDYSGSTGERSNYRVFLAEFGSSGWVWEHLGSHGYHSLYVHRAFYDGCEALREMCAKLSEYPILDESDMSDLEREIEEESWGAYGRSDWSRALEKRAGELGLELPEDLSDSALDEAWCEVRAGGDGGEVEFETAIDAYFRINEVVFGRYRHMPPGKRGELMADSQVWSILGCTVSKK